MYVAVPMNSRNQETGKLAHPSSVQGHHSHCTVLVPPGYLKTKLCLSVRCMY